MTGKARVDESRESVRSHAVRVLARVDEGAWSDRLLQVQESGIADSRDRRFLHMLVLTTLRWQIAIDPRLEPLIQGSLKGLRPHVRAALRMGFCDACVLGRPVPIAVSSTVSAIKSVESARAAGLVNAVLRRALRGGAPTLDSSDAVPGWLLKRWSRALGEKRARSVARATIEPSSPFLVARERFGGRDGVRRRLAEESVVAELSTRHPEGLRVLEGAPQLTSAYKRGEFVLMNEAAALVARLASPPAEGIALDMTAAPGNKASLMAQAANPGVVAMELVEGRARLLARTLAHTAEPGRASTLRADALKPPLAAGSFAHVLLDAPCSGTGTLGTRPEKRVRLKRVDIKRCARLQEALLSRAADLVTPGGSLVYAVCSIEPEEGIEQVEHFLDGHPEFEIEHPRAWLGPENEDLIEGVRPVLRTLPDMGAIDGFVAARMRRKGSPNGSGV